ncbi:MAG: anti-sigma factor [Herbaspirillum sp.]
MDSVTEMELHAYADGQLEPARRAAVEAHLAAHPELALQVRQWRTQNQALHREFDAVLNEPIPQRLVQTLHHRRNWSQGLAAGLVWVACGVTVGWFAHGEVPMPWNNTSAIVSTNFARQALLAHVTYTAEQRHAVEVPAQQEAQLVAWLSKRLKMPIRAPDLNAQGFALLGGRLLPADGMPLAQLMYQATDGERLTLTIRNAGRASKDTSFKIMEQNGNSAFYWIDHDYGYALSGGIDKGRLLQVATAVEQQLRP